MILSKQYRMKPIKTILPQGLSAAAIIKEQHNVLQHPTRPNVTIKPVAEHHEIRVDRQHTLGLSAAGASSLPAAAAAPSKYRSDFFFFFFSGAASAAQNRASEMPTSWTPFEGGEGRLGRG